MPNASAKRWLRRPAVCQFRNAVDALRIQVERLNGAPHSTIERPRRRSACQVQKNQVNRGQGVAGSVLGRRRSERLDQRVDLGRCPNASRALLLNRQAPAKEALRLYEHQRHPAIARVGCMLFVGTHNQDIAGMADTQWAAQGAGDADLPLQRYDDLERVVSVWWRPATHAHEQTGCLL